MNTKSSKASASTGFTARKRFGAFLVMAATLVTTSTFIGSQAQADPYGSLITFGCGSKTAQLNWTSSGHVLLFGGPDRETAGSNLIRELSTSGAHSYNSGYRTFTFQFGASSGHISNVKQVCVAQS